MSGGTRNHNQIALNVARAFDGLRSRGCRYYVADLQVNTPSGLYTYPDVTVACPPVALTSDHGETITNPVVIIEVLSTSTREYDRGLKFELYQTVPTLRDYLLIDQYKIDVEHRFLDGGAWQSRRYTTGDDVVQFSGVPATLRVADTYELVTW